MRRLLVAITFFAPLLIGVSVSANEEPAPSKPIKQAAKAEAAKEETAPADEKASAKSKKSKKENKSEAAERLKEEQAADELAAKIADKLAIIRKERETPPKVAPRPIVRGHAPVIKRPGTASKAKSADGHGHTATAADGHGAVHWSYEGESGPQSWGKLSPANAKCDLGDRQSPIDIRDGIRVDLDPLSFDYKASQFSVVDNGHTIQVNMGAGNYINVSGRSYGLVQFHFHKPSEERVNGRGSEMVVHLVHRNGEGKLAVVALLIERGKANALIQNVWNNLPLEKNDPVNALNNIDLSQLLPKGREYYTYMGSLTTPPCSEGVLWLVMKENIELSPDQIGIFSRLYPMNARPIQKQAGRLIKESN